MRLTDSIETYVADMRSEGRINSDRTEASYRKILELHAEDAGNRDPRTVGRDDVKRTLRRWTNPNSQRTRHAVLVSFYDWAMQEGIRPDNPARQVRRPKKRPTSVTRMNLDECVALIDCPILDRFERRAVDLALCAGLRSYELRHMQGEDFDRDGFIHVPDDIAKGGKERWVPVIADLEQTVQEIRSHVAAREYVLCAQETADPPFNTRQRDLPDEAMGMTTLYKLMVRAGHKAGVKQRTNPHAFRHAFCDHIARTADLQIAQALMGHADIGTTRGYIDAPKLDDLAAALEGVRFSRRVRLLPPSKTARIPFMETAGIEPALHSIRLFTGLLTQTGHDELVRKAELYAAHFAQEATS